jgi:hypothetical protein
VEKRFARQLPKIAVAAVPHNWDKDDLHLQYS